MTHHPLRECVDRLAASGQLVRIEQPIDPRLEAAAIHRRVQQAGGPALLFANVTRLSVSDGQQSVRHAAAGTGNSGRAARAGSPADRAEVRAAAWPCGRPGTIWAPPGGCGTCGPGVSPAAQPRPTKSRSINCRNCSRGRWMAERSSRCRWSTPKMPPAPACGTPTWACTGFNCRAANISRTEEVGLHYQIHRGIAVHHAAASGPGPAAASEYFCRWIARHERWPP